ncbi:MAG: hypothetical protein ACR2IQ_00085 [Minisyncoccia bacterium]
MSDNKDPNMGTGLFKQTSTYTQTSSRHNQNDFGDDDEEEATIIFHESVSEETDEDDD